MDIQIARDHGEMRRQAAARIARDLRRRPDLLLGLATGATPTRTYAALAEMRAREPSLLRQVRIVKLDEWLGLPMRPPATCETYLRGYVRWPREVARSRYPRVQSQPPRPGPECTR